MVGVGASITDVQWAVMSLDAQWKRLIQSSANMLKAEESEERDRQVFGILREGSLQDAKVYHRVPTERAETCLASRP